MRSMFHAWPKQFEPEGKPFLGTQALGIPLVGFVYLVLRHHLNALQGSADWHFFLGFDTLDWVLAALFVGVYTFDFLWDATHWDTLGFQLRSWHIVLILFWLIVSGVILFVWLFWGCLHWSLWLLQLDCLRGVWWGGLLFILLKYWGGKLFAIGGPICIASTFCLAIFHSNNGTMPVGDYLILQGFLLCLLNVWLLSWFESDKDCISKTPNLWNFHWKIHPKFWLLGLVLVLDSLPFWFQHTANTDWINKYKDLGISTPIRGIYAVTAIYWVMWIVPKWFRIGRVYRWVVDAALIFWLL